MFIVPGAVELLNDNMHGSVVVSIEQLNSEICLLGIIYSDNAWSHCLQFYTLLPPQCLLGFYNWPILTNWGIGSVSLISLT